MVFTLKTMLYLGIVLDENLLDKQQVCNVILKKIDLIVLTVAFFTAVHWVCCASKQHISQRFSVVPRERNLLFLLRLHISLEPKRSLHAQFLFFSLPDLSLGGRGKGEAVSWKFDLSNFTLQRRGVANVTCC